MDKENLTTHITEEDVDYVEKEFARTPRPLSLAEIAEKLAYHKTANQRTKDVKKYDPSCQYETGDSIYKEYDESLPVSSKTVEHFTGAVVFQVVSKTYYKEFKCEMLEVDYTGGGLFRKYIDYMKKTKTQVLLPSNLDGKAMAPEVMEKEADPRLNYLPMTERDIRSIERNLKATIAKSPKFFNWNDYWQLLERQIDIPDEKIKDIENHIQETKESAATEDIVKTYFGLEASHDQYELYCLSLNYTLDKKFKKDFLFVSPLNWGKWHLKNIVNSYLDGLPLSAPSVKLPEMEEAEKPQMSTFNTFPLKVYLTWREVLSGGIKVPRSLNKDLSHAREYTFTDTEEGKSYIVYYYPSLNIFVGLKEFFASNNISQGTSLTLERNGPVHFNFWVKKSKKKLTVVKLSYAASEDKFRDEGEEAFSFSMPNKIIYLEREILHRLLPLYEQRDAMDLGQLLILIFKNFGLEANDYPLHFLRAYHLVDVLKQTTQEEVEATLLNSPDFYKSEKKKGIFFYRAPVEVKEEAAAEFPAAPLEAPLPEIPPEEIPAVEVRMEAEGVFPPLEVPLPYEEKPRKEEVPPHKKEKPARKKRVRAEGERAPRVRKSERKVIEERIEIEESAQEALSAVKEEEEKIGARAERAEVREKGKKEEFKPLAPKEPKFGIFAEKLKTALDKKKKEEKKK